VNLQLNFMHHTTGAEMFMISARGHLEDTQAPFTFSTSRADDFLASTKANRAPTIAEMGTQLEGYVVSGASRSGTALRGESA
jgi:hypothetical protein